MKKALDKVRKLIDSPFVKLRAHRKGKEKTRQNKLPASPERKIFNGLRWLIAAPFYLVVAYLLFIMMIPGFSLGEPKFDADSIYDARASMDDMKRYLDARQSDWNFRKKKALRRNYLLLEAAALKRYNVNAVGWVMGDVTFSKPIMPEGRAHKLARSIKNDDFYSSFKKFDGMTLSEFLKATDQMLGNGEVSYRPSKQELEEIRLRVKKAEHMRKTGRG